MEFIRVTTDDLALIDAVYSILKASGTYMAEKLGLMHWATPYGKEMISEDVKNKQVYLVKSENDFLATFTLSDQTSHPFENNPDEDAVYLSKFAVKPSIMKSGVGSACITYMEENCKRRNKTKLRFDVYIKSEHAIKFYIKMGYTQISSPDPSVICMEKVLK